MTNYRSPTTSSFISFLIYLYIEKKLPAFYEDLLSPLYKEGKVFLNPPEKGYPPLSLVLGYPSLDPPMKKLLFQKGGAFYLPLEKFIKKYFSLISFFSPPKFSHRKILLLYLPSNLEKILKSFFSFWGYSYKSFSSIKECPKEENFSYSCFYISPRLSLSQKKECLFFLKEIPRVDLLRDFSQGSIYEDLKLPWKEISSVIFSPAEYLIFLRSTLIQFFLYKISTSSFPKKKPPLDFFFLFPSSQILEYYETLRKTSYSQEIQEKNSLLSMLSFFEEATFWLNEILQEEEKALIKIRFSP